MISRNGTSTNLSQIQIERHGAYWVGVYLGIRIIGKGDYINIAKVLSQISANGEKRYYRWKRCNAAKELLSSISADMGVTVRCLSFIETDVPNEFKGTYIHENILSPVLCWASPTFQCKVIKILNQKAIEDSTIAKNAEIGVLHTELNNKDDQIADLKRSLVDLQHSLDEMNEREQKSNRDMKRQMNMLVSKSNNTTPPHYDKYVHVRPAEPPSTITQSADDQLRALEEEYDEVISRFNSHIRECKQEYVEMSADIQLQLRESNAVIMRSKGLSQECDDRIARSIEVLEQSHVVLKRADESIQRTNEFLKHLHTISTQDLVSIYGTADQRSAMETMMSTKIQKDRSSSTDAVVESAPEPPSSHTPQYKTPVEWNVFMYNPTTHSIKIAVHQQRTLGVGLRTLRQQGYTREILCAKSPNGVDLRQRLRDKLDAQYSAVQIVSLSLTMITLGTISYQQIAQEIRDLEQTRMNTQ